MLALLKTKTKVSLAERKRKVYDVAAVFKVLAREEGKTPYTNTKEATPQNQDKFGQKKDGKMVPEILGKQDQQMGKK